MHIYISPCPSGSIKHKKSVEHFVYLDRGSGKPKNK